MALPSAVSLAAFLVVFAFGVLNSCLIVQDMEMTSTSHSMIPIMALATLPA